MSLGYSKDFVSDADNWFSHDTGKEERAQDLISADWPLNFGAAFIQACIDDRVDSLGTYCMGWEL